MINPRSESPASGFSAAQERMRHVPEPVEPDAPLPQGEAGAAYPVNEQHLEDFQVGGVERSLPPAEQLAQLVSYMESSYPLPSSDSSGSTSADSTSADDVDDRYLAALPDRLTHAAMLMLGSGLDHTMPGVAYGMDVDARDLPDLDARVFIPAGSAQPTGRWAVALHPDFGPRAVEHYWRPLVAAVAQLSGTTIVDLDDTCGSGARGTLNEAFEYIAAQNPSDARVTVWAAGDGAALLAEQHPADSVVLTFPVSGPPAGSGGKPVLVRTTGDYTVAQAGPGIIATPEEYRRIVRDIADDLRA